MQQERRYRSDDLRDHESRADLQKDELNLGVYAYMWTSKLQTSRDTQPRDIGFEMSSGHVKGSVKHQAS